MSPSNEKSKSSNFKENKFVQEMPVVGSGKAAKMPPSLNEIPKDTNPQ